MEPFLALAGVTDVGVPDVQDARELYSAAYPRLVQAVTLVCGSRADAEEVVQEAFIRLLVRWSTISGYDDPEGWVRLVAFRLAISRRQRARYRLRFTRRVDADAQMDPPTADGVDVLRALRAIPLKQREVVVLHHLMDMSIEQIAAELGVPTGTVKSRLARARSALAPLLRIEVSDYV